MRKVVGIGETVYDIIFKNEQPVNATPGGSTYNSMISLGRAGIPSEFISETGDDRVGRLITQFLETNGVSAKNVCIHKGQKSALSLAFLNDQNDAQYVFYKDHAKDKLDFNYPDIHENDIVLFGSYYAINPVVRSQVKEFLEYARGRGAILYYDINFRASHKHEANALFAHVYENLKLAHIVRASDEDCAVLFEQSDVDDIYENIIKKHTNHFIQTKGANPAELRSLNGLKRQYPVQPVQTVSTVGAGDSFNAGFIYGLIRYNILSEHLQDGLTIQQWDGLFATAQAFSANVCQSMCNYIDADFQPLRQGNEQCAMCNVQLEMLQS